MVLKDNPVDSGKIEEHTHAFSHKNSGASIALTALSENDAITQFEELVLNPKDWVYEGIMDDDDFEEDLEELDEESGVFDEPVEDLLDCSGENDITIQDEEVLEKNGVV